VVLNLLVNAVEALPREGGKVRARLRVEDLPRPEEGLAPGPAARLEVSDNGCGMSEESLARLFEPFYTTKVTGRGLGLAAVQGILRAHQGVIRVVSRVGEGTTMTVWLPALAGKAEVMENPKTTMGAFQGRALLVDDEADVRRVTHRMLERLGIEVTAAGDGASGIAAFQENKDSVVGALLDLTMPDMDGLEVYRRLLETRPDLPALLISGYGMEEMRERLKSFPRMVLLQKPFGQKELMVALESIGWPKAKAPKTP
jgi:CheY-like chemotaxis protein